jgi:WD40 repeat protein/mono/diheme cytochrome c family protein
MKLLLSLGACVAALLLSATAVRAADPPKEEPISFHRQLRPILQQKCAGCHQPAKKRAGLLLLSYDDAQKGGDNGPLWVAGKPEQSLLVKSLKGTDGQKQMPEGDPPLAAEQIELFVKWIAQGARDDTPEQFKKTLVVQGPPTYTAPVAITAMEHSPDGSALAIAGYREALLHKPDGSGLLGRLVGLSERIESIVFSPDGNTLLVAGGSAGRFGELQFWDWKQRKLERSVIPSFDTVYGASFASDGKRVAFGCADNSARIIEASSGKQLVRIDHHLDWVFGTALSQDGKYIATASRDKTVKVCETATGAFIGNLTTLDPTQPASSHRNLVRRPGRDECLTGGEDGIAKLYTVQASGGAGGSLLRRYPKLPGRVEAVAFSADGKMLAAGGVGGTVLVLGADDARQIASLSVPTTIFALSFQRDGKVIAAAGLDGKVRLFNLPDGKPVKDFVPVPLGESPKPD